MVIHDTFIIYEEIFADYFFRTKNLKLIQILELNKSLISCLSLIQPGLWSIFFQAAHKILDSLQIRRKLISISKLIICLETLFRTITIGFNKIKKTRDSMTLLILTIIGLSAYYYIKRSQTDRSGHQDPHAYAYARNEHPEILDKGQTTGRPRKNIN